MKIKFFEKNIFDPTAREKPTIRTNDKVKTGLGNITSDYKKQYKSEPLERQIRQIKIPIENLKFYTDGSKFMGTFKKVDITSGEPEIISSVETAGRTKRINVELSTQITPEMQDEETSSDTQFIREPKLFNPACFINIGNFFKRFSDGWSDLNSYINAYSSNDSFQRVSKFRAFWDFMRSSLRQQLYHPDIYVRNLQLQTKTLPPEIGSLSDISDNEVTLDAVDDRNQRAIPVEIKYGILKNTITDIQYWKYSGKIKNEYSIKDFSLYGYGGSAKVITPLRHKVSMENAKATQVKQNGDPLDNGFSEFMNNYAPINLQTTDFVFTPWGSSPSYGFIITLSAKYNNFLNNYKSLYSIFNDVFQPYFLRWTRNDIRYLTLVALDQVNSVFIDITYVRGFGSTISQHGINQAQTSLNSELSALSEQIEILLRESAPDNIQPVFPVNRLPGRSKNLTLSDGSIGLAPAENRVLLNGDYVTNRGKTRETPPTGTPWSPGEDMQSIERTEFFTFATLSLTRGKMRPAGADISETALQNFKDDILPIGLSPPGDNSYQIVDMDELGDFIFIKNNGLEKINRNEIQSLIIKYLDNSQDTARFGSDGRQVDWNTQEDIGWQLMIASLFRALKYDFANQLLRSSRSGADAINSPDLGIFTRFYNANRNNLENLRRIFTSKRTIFSLELLTTFVDLNIEDRNLLQTITRSDWPWVKLSALNYKQPEEGQTQGKIVMFLTRAEEAPVPNRNYFDSVQIAGRPLSFSTAEYQDYLNKDDSDNEYKQRGAEYKWPANKNFLSEESTVPLIFKKAGTSRTLGTRSSDLVRKSTVKTVEKKVFPRFLAGLKVIDFDFDSTKFEITFEGNIAATRFQAISVKSPEGVFITRELRPTGTGFTRTQVGNNTNFKWENIPDFFNLKNNKEYVFEITAGANNEELKLFIPRPGLPGFHFVEDLKIQDNDLDFTLRKFGSFDISSQFINVSIQNPNGTDFIAAQDEQDGEYETDLDADLDNQIDYSFKNAAQGKRALVSGDKFNLVFTVQDLPSFELSIVKLTDIYIDTVVILNTNLDDVFLIDQLDQDLIHPSDVNIFKSEIENGLRHIVLFLKQPITAKNINLINRRLAGSSKSREIGQILLLKKIGEFSQFGDVSPKVNQSKVTTRTQIGNSHVISRQKAINYNINMPALSKQADWELAQDIFSRAADYNEFLIWVSGGDIVKNRENVNGFRFVDIVKSLTMNEENIVFEDGRLNSGLNFAIQTVQVE